MLKEREGGREGKDEPGQPNRKQPTDPSSVKESVNLVVFFVRFYVVCGSCPVFTAYKRCFVYARMTWYSFYGPDAMNRSLHHSPIAKLLNRLSISRYQPPKRSLVIKNVLNIPDSKDLNKILTKLST